MALRYCRYGPAVLPPSIYRVVLVMPRLVEARTQQTLIAFKNTRCLLPGTAMASAVWDGCCHQGDRDKNHGAWGWHVFWLVVAIQ